MRCPNCGGVVATGSLCGIGDSDSIEITGDGGALNPHTLEVRVNPDPGNRLTTEYGDGLLATLPDVITAPPTVQAFNPADQAIPNNALTLLVLGEEKYDTPDEMHNNISNSGRIWFTTPGVYLVTLNVTWRKRALGDRSVLVRLNGSGDLAYQSKQAFGADGSSTDLFIAHSLSFLEEFEDGDYIESYALQTSGTELVVHAGDGSPFLSATKL